MEGVTILYIRVSSETQNLDRQIQAFKDIGATEYTPYRLTATGATDWELLVNQLNSSIYLENYVEFDITGYDPVTDFVPVSASVASSIAFVAFYLEWTEYFQECESSFFLMLKYFSK